MSDEYKKTYVKQVLNDLSVAVSTPCPCDRKDPEWEFYRAGYDHAMDRVMCYLELLRKTLEE